MKQIRIIFGLIAVIAAVWIAMNTSYYPSLPIEDLSAKEAIGKLQKSDEIVVELAADDRSIWYLTKSQSEEDSTPNQHIKQLIESSGWKFKEQLGAGLFFEKEDEELLVTTQMWTRKYVLVQVPNNFKEL